MARRLSSVDINASVRWKREALRCATHLRHAKCECSSSASLWRLISNFQSNVQQARECLRYTCFARTMTEGVPRSKAAVLCGADGGALSDSRTETSDRRMLSIKKRPQSIFGALPRVG